MSWRLAAGSWQLAASFGSNQAVHQAGQFGDSQIEDGGCDQSATDCSIDPMLELGDRASCDQKHSPPVRPGSPSKSLREICANRIGGAHELNAHRPEIELVPSRDLRTKRVGQVRGPAIRRKAPMSAARHVDLSHRCDVFAPTDLPAASCKLQADA